MNDTKAVKPSIPPERIGTVAEKKFKAATCPTNPAHKQTRIYGHYPAKQLVYCKCDDCGEVWTQKQEDSGAT